MKTIINQLSRVCYDHGLGLLVIRIAAGLIFLVHGYEKFQNIQGPVRLMELLGFGGYMGYFIAGLEVVGGIALILGVATRLFGVLFGVEMAVAALRVGVPRGFHGYEFEMLLAAVSFALALAGSGKFSIYKMECNYCGGMLCTGSKGCPARTN